MSAAIHTWFPTPIYVSENIISTPDNEKIKNLCIKIEDEVDNGSSNWNCNTYNTLGTFDLHDDSRFSILLNSVENHVENFSKSYGSAYQYKCQSSWININYKNSYQEFHCHANSTFSAVYYVATPPLSGRIIFENPTEPDMIPIKDIKEPNELSYRTCHYQPEAGTLIIFRSYLRHMVEIGQNEDPRITIAFNF